jgi:nitroreductase
MELQDIIHSRRSVRSYMDKPIETAVLQKILEAGMVAPSAVNTQPWFIVAIHSPDKMAELRECLSVPASRLRPELERSFPERPGVVEDTYRVFSCLGNAPACLMAFTRKPGPPTTDTVLSIAAAMENMLLAAWDQGVGSCWMTGPVNFGLNEYVREKFAPGKGELLSLAPLGYPQDVPVMPPRKNDRYCII